MSVPRFALQTSEALLQEASYKIQKTRLTKSGPSQLARAALPLRNLLPHRGFLSARDGQASYHQSLLLFELVHITHQRDLRYSTEKLQWSMTLPWKLTKGRPCAKLRCPLCVMHDKVCYYPPPPPTTPVRVGCGHG